MLLTTTFLINHFDLFGLRQVWFYARNKELTHISFRTPLFYKYVRHPLYFSFLMIFWFAPVMTLGHLVFSAGMTTYIFIGIYHEEKDLIRYYGERYREYRRRVPKIIPFTLTVDKRKVGEIKEVNIEQRKEAVMKNTVPVKTMFERIVVAMNRQPSIARGAIHTTATYTGGQACELESGQWKMKADMSKRSGGGETGPSPGEYMSMALAACQTITTVLWASHYDLPLEALQVKVDVEKDSRGLYGVGGQPPQWKGVRYHVDIKSPASEEEVQRVLDAAYEHSPMRGNLEYGFTVEHDAKVTAPAV